MATLPEEALIYWQTGAYPVKWSGGTSIQQNYAKPTAVAAAKYWQNLYHSGALANISTNGSYKAEADGTLLTDFAASWYPDVFTTPGSTQGQWRVANLPQWKAGQHIYPNDGGSLTVVTKYTKHPRQAAAFAIWLETSQAAWYEWVRKPSYLFPTNTPTLRNPGFLTQKISLTGPQQVWKPYADMADHIRQGWQWSPIEPYVETEMADGLAEVLEHKTTLSSSLKSLQKEAMSDAKTEGFSPKAMRS
jgi:multiple sugar transport system substrate-binding protein